MVRIREEAEKEAMRKMEEEEDRRLAAIQAREEEV